MPRSPGLLKLRYIVHLLWNKDKKVSYFKMPVPDFARREWGYVLGGIATNYVLVEDNYVVFASSERG